MQRMTEASNKLNTRRSRGKKEASFLESVRDVLQTLTLEIRDVKQCIKELQSAQAYHDPMFPDMSAYEFWSDWNSWNSLGFDTGRAHEAADQVSSAVIPKTDTVVRITRDEILQYQSIAPVEDPIWTTYDILEPLSNAGRCHKCKEHIGDCICNDIFCRRCLMFATRCACADSHTFLSNCPHCGERAHESIFEIDYMSDMSLLKACPSCGHESALIDWSSSTERCLSQGAEECSRCHRIDAQESIKQCDALCGAYGHDFCMKQSTPPGCTHQGSLHVCDACDRKQVVVVCGFCENEHADDAGEDIRERELQRLEVHANAILDLVDAVDAGKVDLPRTARDLAVSLVKDVHTWLQSHPTAGEVSMKIKHIEALMSEIMKKVVR